MKKNNPIIKTTIPEKQIKSCKKLTLGIKQMQPNTTKTIANNN